ncbi:MAG: hypothetical protein ACTSRI_17445 [Promethearchaeota archaeon]
MALATERVFSIEYYQSRLLKVRIIELEQKIVAFPNNKELKSLKRGLKIHLSWERKDFEKFKEVYLRYFKLSHEVFIVG